MSNKLTPHCPPNATSDSRSKSRIGKTNSPILFLPAIAFCHANVGCTVCYGGGTDQEAWERKGKILSLLLYRPADHQWSSLDLRKSKVIKGARWLTPERLTSGTSYQWRVPPLFISALPHYTPLSTALLHPPCQLIKLSGPSLSCHCAQSLSSVSNSGLEVPCASINDFITL